MKKRRNRPVEAQPPRPKRKQPEPVEIDLAVDLDGYKDGLAGHSIVTGTVYNRRHTSLKVLQEQGFNTTPPPGISPWQDLIHRREQ